VTVGTGGPAVQAFIVAGASDVLRPLLELVVADPDATVTAVSGPETARERLVVEIDPDRANALSVALGSRVLIEPDAPLHP
jgi:hypothetical protein